ncbi:hypothetical protein [Abyssicoccus albus]|uniref:hypothetical protein n=1 Tax=Abyssicoccus albus TaxID=1817405 RepID=UPI00097E403A|nr:hypothetical protein [Abyssicoccus albus]AQL56669.1 hypothetical protein BVH56_06930 [Abyssicoccus albus]
MKQHIKLMHHYNQRKYRAVIIFLILSIVFHVISNVIQQAEIGDLLLIVSQFIFMIFVTFSIALIYSYFEDMTSHDYKQSIYTFPNHRRHIVSAEFIYMIIIHCVLAAVWTLLHIITGRYELILVSISIIFIAIFMHALIFFIYYFLNFNWILTLMAYGIIGISGLFYYSPMKNWYLKYHQAPTFEYVYIPIIVSIVTILLTTIGYLLLQRKIMHKTYC